MRDQLKNTDYQFSKIWERKQSFFLKELKIFGFTLFQLQEFVRIGKLEPLNWPQMTEHQRLQALADGDMRVKKESVQKLIQGVSADLLRSIQITDYFQNLSRRMNDIELAIERLSNKVTERDKHFKIRDLAKASGYSEQYIRNKIARISPYTGIVKIPRMEFKLFKRGKSWYCGHADFYEVKSAWDYDFLRDIENRKHINMQEDAKVEK